MNHYRFDDVIIGAHNCGTPRHIDHTGSRAEVISSTRLRSCS
ncbi:MAG TPA: hypothetical protein VEI57_07640 [Nitrospirota bacterium]|nr:hypothetical protein [Nitrospirota bacterium]